MFGSRSVALLLGVIAVLSFVSVSYASVTRVSVPKFAASAVPFDGLIVTADLSDFTNMFYAEDPLRSYGIKVVYGGTPVVSRGDSVNITGDLLIDGNKEAYLSATNVAVNSSGNDIPAPLGMVAKLLGGSDTPDKIGVSTPPGTGLYNKGMLVKCWGKVTGVYPAEKCFYLDDGSILDDGTGHAAGIKVSWTTQAAGPNNPAIIPPVTDSYVYATGISSSECPVGTNVIRVLRLRTQGDITTVTSPDATGPNVDITVPALAVLTKPASLNTVLIAGTATDTESGVASVQVGFTATGVTNPPAAWDSATYDSVTHIWTANWQNPTPQRIWVQATDFAGNATAVYRDITTIASANVIFVSGARPDNTGDGLSWATAKKTVQAGLDAAYASNPKSEVWVAKGTYLERITLKDGVILYGGFNVNDWYREQRNWTANVTILDGSRGGSVVTCPVGATETTVIDGFTIRNGRALRGGGINCVSSSPTIRNNIITGNNARSTTYYGQGAGIYVSGGSPTIESNRIESNIADSTSGIYLYAYGGAIYCSGGSPKISGNVMVNNTASSGGGIYCTSSLTSPTITNNTIADNTVTNLGGGIFSTSSATPIISNNIVAFCTSGIYKHTSSGALTLRNNCVGSNTDNNDYINQTPGVGDIIQNPVFVNKVGGDYRLSAGSPCIDAGWDSAASIPAKDMDGNPRSVDIPSVGTGIIDIGAYEVQLSN